jgi:DNA-binding NarL/FixJ family response regulator
MNTPNQQPAASLHECDLNPLELLTPREMEVVQQLLELKTNKEIARELHICTRVVERHVASICKKLRVERRVEVILALRLQGLVRKYLL